MEPINFSSLGAVRGAAKGAAPLDVIKKLGAGNYVSMEQIRAAVPGITDAEIIALADSGKLELAPYGGPVHEEAGKTLVRDAQGNRYIGAAIPRDSSKNTVRSGAVPIYAPTTGEAQPPMSDDAPRYTPDDPNERAAMRTRQAVQHHGGPTTGIGGEIPFLIQHYYDNAMAGPRAMARVAHGELDPMSREGIGAGMSAAWSLMPMQSPFAPRGSLGAGGGSLAPTGPRDLP